MLMCVRTTVNLPDELYGEVRRRAADEGRTVTSFLEQALRDALARHEAGDKPPFVVRPFRGDGVMPGVDLTSNAALLELEEEGTDVDSRR
ncbi:CopG-like RHH_1 or ribbon-helix-helix domain-containing protein, RHH_5 [Microlunatus sagamiharensis]|uniref:CopG-like RHH_1 or ribbon-helix-helix domain-containing protein, RHH_5 n=1 Tax=Microlunatus sagamiharensis TaxID=546874 RepID=A0A1H2N503_9ACTN|nr:CopG-like RHH_1 or ribbon-helix-helix domain-containing protein, RHH_5 [Microlunatus sagamiharensis]